MKMPDLIKLIGWTAGGALALSASLVAFALTPWSLKAGVALAQKFVPALTVQAVQGTLADAHLTGIAYRTEALSADVESLTLTLTNLRPLDRHLDVGLVRVSGLRLAVKASGTQPSEPTATNAAPFCLPVSLNLTRVEVTDAAVATPQVNVTLQSLLLAGGMKLDKATIDSLALNALALNLPEAPTAAPATAAAPVPLAQTLRELLNKPLLTPVKVSSLPLRVDAKAVRLSDLTLNGETLLEEASAAFVAEPTQVTVSLLNLTHPLAQANLTGKVQMDGVLKADLSGRITPRTATLEGVSVNADVAVDTAGPVKAQVTATHAKNTVVLTVMADAGQSQPTVDLSLTGGLDLTPFQALTGVQGNLKDVDLSLKGSWADYEAKLSAKAASPLLAKEAELNVSAQGKELTIPEAKLLARVGENTLEADLSGTLSETNATLTGTIRSAWKELQDFAQLTGGALPDSTGSAQIVLTAGSDAAFSPASLQANVSSLTAQGTVAGVPFAAKATGKVQGLEQVEVSALNLNVSDAALSGHGTLKKDALSGAFTLNARDLSRLTKTLKGRITGSGTLTGTVAVPQLEARLRAENLSAPEVSLKKAELTARLTPIQDKTGLTPKADVQLTAESVWAGGQTIRRLSATLTGTEAAHTLAFQSEGSAVALNATLQGSLRLKDNRWSGSLVSADLKTPPGTWSAQGKPTLDVDLAQTQVAVGAHCWTSTQQSLSVCLKDKVTAGQTGKVVLDVKNAELALLKDYLPEDLDLSGRTNATAELTWTAPAAAHAKAVVAVTGTNLGVATETRRGKETVTLEKTELTATLTPEKASVQGQLALKDGGQLTADVTVTDPLSKKEISGRVQADGIELEKFNPILGAVSPQLTAQGRLSADVRPAGTLYKPALYGSVSLNDFSARGEAVPLDLKSSDVMLHFEGDQSQLIADLKTEQGTVSVKGSAEWKDPAAPTAKVAVKGDRVRVSMPPYVSAHVTPDVEAFMTLSKLKLSGSIRINEAKLTVSALPTEAISASEDEEIITPNQVAVRVHTPLQIESSLMIHLGDNVNLSAFGLKSDLTGDMAVTQTDQALGLNGTIKLVNGTFKAYGQDLVINKGNLTFAGPVAKPMLDFEAIRNPETIQDDVTAGVRIKGSSEAPQTEIFTEPAMSQAEALSYILRGQGLETASESDNAMLTSALLGLGLSQTGQLVSGIGQMLRVSELNIATAGSGDDSELVVSGYVLPGLQVKYAIGIFDSIATLTLRYRLMARLFVEASSGTAQSLDLLYAFEF